MGGSLLVGDFGGTNARLALSQEGKLTEIKEYKCADYSNPGGIINAYVGGLKCKPETAVIAVAGPAENPEAIIFTNGPWKQEKKDFKNIGIENVTVINDFEAICYSISALRPQDCTTLVSGNPAFFPSAVLAKPESFIPNTSRMIVAKPQNRFVAIGPGTGLGIGSGFLTDAGRFCVLGGEGSHAIFAPATEEEFAVKKHLEDNEGMQVTNETFASGTGLVTSFNGYAKVHNIDHRIKDASEIIGVTNSADRKARQAAFWSLRVFARTLGSSAASAALTNNAQTIFMGGGVISKLGSYFDQISFTEELRNNDLYSNNILISTPVMMITHKHPGLLGAQAYHDLSNG